MEIPQVFSKVLNQFEEQFQVELRNTGHEIAYEENGGLGEVEYWVNGLIEAKVDGLDIEVGGWFSHDTRDDEDNIYCLLVIKLNGETIGEYEGIQSWYNTETKKWNELTWRGY